tara:strand:- start:1147 stop:2877 length:1731 start_codon:yes stop_codon:yes gene_type:complete
MPDLELQGVSPLSFNCEGGLVLNRSTFIMQPGQALELTNFEPDVGGGYKRILGFRPFVNQIVPETSVSTEAVLLTTQFNNFVLAARGEKIFSSASTELSAKIASDTAMSGSGTITVDSTDGFSSSGTLQINSEVFTYTGKTTTTFTGVTRATSSTSAAAHAVDDVVSESWTVRDTGRTNAKRYNFEKYNFDGNDKIIVVDQTNAPTIFNTSLSASDVSESSVSGAKHVVAFKDHMFYSGMASTPQEVVFSQPSDEDAFNTGSGAGSFSVDDTIVGLKVFRENLFIFCENRIFKLGGSSSSDFAVVPVTRNIGCINGFTILEFAGDLVFLGPDGLRTVAGTARIGDVELGTISANVQQLFRDNLTNADAFVSLVIPDKTQYRIFFSKEGQAETSSIGATCVMKGQTFEFSQLKGIRPACADTIVDEGDVIVLHGGFDGFVYRQERGNTFDGTLINAKYRSPDLSMGDPGVRKHMQRVNVNYAPESTIDADLFVRYDYESNTSTRPAAYPLDSTNVAGIYGSSIYGSAVYGGPSQPIVRKAVEGSGFAVALRVEDGATATAPYTLKGFQLEFQVGARR